MKGYTNRIKSGIREHENIYIEHDFLKKLDLTEVGFMLSREFNLSHSNLKLRLKNSVGTDFTKNLYYWKLKQEFIQDIPISENYSVEL